jgi:hypothetical protein
MKKISILDLAEDLVGDDSIKTSSQAQTTQRKKAISKKAPVTKPKTLDKLILNLARTLEIDHQEINEWITEQSAPQCLLIPILLTSQRLRLNPLLGQIAWELNEKKQWKVFVPIDGWIAMIHREPSFQGIAFNQSNQTENGIPIWMECSIFRYDLIRPITVREYFSELKTEHPMWVDIPYRMLRHKTLQQCARLTFAICMPESKISNPNKALSKMEMYPQNKNAPNAKRILKEKLISKLTHTG